MFSKAVDLSPIAVFIAVLVGAGVGGAIGALTALPVTASLKVIVRYLFRDRLGAIDSAPVPGATLTGRRPLGTAAARGGAVRPGRLRLSGANASDAGELLMSGMSGHASGRRGG